MIEQLRIGLIGAGAVGSLFATALLYNKVPFSWVVRNPQRRTELDCLDLQHGSQQLHFELPPDVLVDCTASLPACDWTLVAVKAHHVETVLAALPAHASGKVLVAANGLHTGAHHLGLLYGGARLLRGKLSLTPDSKLLVGGLPGVADAAPEVVPLLMAPWLRCGANEVIIKRMWHKLCLNCVINPLSALLDRPNGELLAWADAPLAQGVLAEIAAVAEAELGTLWSYSAGTLRRALVELISSTATNSSSMREDLHAGRETEISRLNLAVADLGDGLGHPCPLARALGIMITAITNKGRDTSVL
jgi:2-dehydropantoate 2-reductase